MLSSKIYNIDIDGVLCENGDHTGYATAKPILRNIHSINQLAKNHFIRLFTSRLSIDKKVTVEWLRQHNVEYASLVMDKPSGDYYIDDKAQNFLPYLRPKTNKDDRLVICMSGGLDSTIAYHYALKMGYNPICLFFNVGQPYWLKEKKVLATLGIKFIDIDLSFYNHIPSEGDIIPNRNAIFANIASTFGDRVWIVGLKYEDHYLMFDKNRQFYNYTSMAISQSIGRSVVVETPFGEWTKTDIMDYAKKEGLMDVVDKTTSCYHETKHRCGECGLCIRRFIAGEVAGYKEEFDFHPMHTPRAKKLYNKYLEAYLSEDYSHYSKDRIEESLIVMRKYL